MVIHHRQSHFLVQQIEGVPGKHREKASSCQLALYRPVWSQLLSFVHLRSFKFCYRWLSECVDKCCWGSLVWQARYHPLTVTHQVKLTIGNSCLQTQNVHERIGFMYKAGEAWVEKKTAVVLCWAEHWTINSYSIPSDWLSHVLLQYNSWTIWTLKFELNFSSNFNITSNAAKEPFPIHTIGSTRASVVICATDIGSASSSCCLEMQARKFAKASSALATRMIITNYKQTDKVKQSLGLVVYSSTMNSSLPWAVAS